MRFRVRVNDLFLEALLNLEKRPAPCFRQQNVQENRAYSHCATVKPKSSVES